MEIYFAYEIADEIIWNCSPSIAVPAETFHFSSAGSQHQFSSKILRISMNFLVNRDLFWLNAAAPELFSTLWLTFPLSLNRLLKPNFSMSAIGNRDHLTNCWKIKNYHTWCQQTSASSNPNLYLPAPLYASIPFFVSPSIKEPTRRATCIIGIIALYWILGSRNILDGCQHGRYSCRRPKWPP